jgi:hypothetical protein
MLRLSGSEEKRTNTALSAEKFLIRIEKLIQTETHPETIKKILEELHLNDLDARDQSFNDFMTYIQTNALCMRKFIHQFKEGVLKNEGVCAILAYIQDNDLISQEELEHARALFQLQLNLLCIYEAFTVTMLNSLTFAEDYYQHVIQRRKSCMPGSPAANFFFGTPLNTKLFERLKLISVEPGFLNCVFHHRTGDKKETTADLQEMSHEYKLSSWNKDFDLFDPQITNESHSCVAGMNVNILEAVWQDSTGKTKLQGGIDNAIAGTGLMALAEAKNYSSALTVKKTVLPDGVTLKDDGIHPLLPKLKVEERGKKIHTFKIDQEWMHLYNTWNLRFVIANYDAVILPIKLLIPSVMAATPENFKDARLLALYLSGTLYLNEQFTQNKFFKPNITFKNKDKILAQWGLINKTLATAALQKHFPKVQSPEKLFNEKFGCHRTYNFLKQLSLFAWQGYQYRFAVPEKELHRKDQLVHQANMA